MGWTGFRVIRGTFTVSTGDDRKTAEGYSLTSLPDSCHIRSILAKAPG